MVAFGGVGMPGTGVGAVDRESMEFELRESSSLGTSNPCSATSWLCEATSSCRVRRVFRETAKWL